MGGQARGWGQPPPYGYGGGGYGWGDPGMQIAGGILSSIGASFGRKR